MTPERRSIPLAAAKIEVRQDGDANILTGYAAVFYDPQNAGTEYKLDFDIVERIMPGAFDSAIAQDDIRALFNHDPNHVLGRNRPGTLRLTVDSTGLHYEDDLPNTSDGRDIPVLIQRGDITGSSFGFAIAGPEGQRFRREGDLFIREILAVKLFDVGPVTFPAYTATSTSTRSIDSIRQAAHHALSQAEAAETTARAQQHQARARARVAEIRAKG